VVFYKFLKKPIDKYIKTVHNKIMKRGKTLKGDSKMKVKKIEIERTARNLAILKSAYVDGRHENAYNESLGIIGTQLFGCRGKELLLSVRKLAEVRFGKYANAIVTYDDGTTALIPASKAFAALDAVYRAPKSYEGFWEKLALALAK